MRWRSRLGFDARYRQREVERRPLSRLALRPDLSAVRLDDALGDRQAEARAEARGALRLPVGVEDVLQILVRDARAGVADDEEHLAVVARGAAGDAAARRRELHRVADEIREHLRDAVVIGVDGRQV